MNRMSIIEEGGCKHVRMAHLATVGSHSVNGVARLHTDLLKSQLLRDFHDLWPERFNNKTNGVTPRLWILHANPRLTRLVSSRIGSTWIDRNLAEVRGILPFADEPDFLEALWRVKYENKRDVAETIRGRTGVDLAPDAMFVVQIKRFHEYKRQLLACLEIVAHYLALKRGDPSAQVTPRAYIFAGKAAPGYAMAKLHIRLVNDVASVINGDPEMRGRLAVAFVPNYGVSLAEAIIPAADVSLQISTAGKEASGTSNMKFAMNGALTIGTLDGANLEIREAVGPENFLLFGLTTPEVQAELEAGYDPGRYIARSPALAEALALIGDGFFSLGDRDRFRPIVDRLRTQDPFLVCADFDAYCAATAAAAAAYRDPRAWSRRALHNIVGASAFSSDATIAQYAREIWGIQPVKTNLGALGEGVGGR